MANPAPAVQQKAVKKVKTQQFLKRLGISTKPKPKVKAKPSLGKGEVVTAPTKEPGFFDKVSNMFSGTAAAADKAVKDAEKC